MKRTLISVLSVCLLVASAVACSSQKDKGVDTAAPAAHAKAPPAAKPADPSPAQPDPNAGPAAPPPQAAQGAQPTPPAAGANGAAGQDTAAQQAQAEQNLPPCGDEGQPDCPLQHWMNQHTKKATQHHDLPAMANAYRWIAAMTPDPAWNSADPSWRAIALEGEHQAVAGNFNQAKAQCKKCHKAFKHEYEHRFAHREVPPAPPGVQP